VSSLPFCSLLLSNQTRKSRQFSALSSKVHANIIPRLLTLSKKLIYQYFHSISIEIPSYFLQSNFHHPSKHLKFPLEINRYKIFTWIPIQSLRHSSVSDFCTKRFSNTAFDTTAINNHINKFLSSSSATSCRCWIFYVIICALQGISLENHGKSDADGEINKNRTQFAVIEFICFTF
jgi:hypothetical protein